MTTLTVDLPDNLIKEAKAAGLLNATAIEAMLRETIQRQSTNTLFKAADNLATASIPPMSLDDIQQEVNAVREQRELHASGT